MSILVSKVNLLQSEEAVDPVDAVVNPDVQSSQLKRYIIIIETRLTSYVILLSTRYWFKKFEQVTH